MEGGREVGGREGGRRKERERQRETGSDQDLESHKYLETSRPVPNTSLSFPSSSTNWGPSIKIWGPFSSKSSHHLIRKNYGTSPASFARHQIQANKAILVIMVLEDAMAEPVCKVVVEMFMSSAAMQA